MGGSRHGCRLRRFCRRRAHFHCPSQDPGLFPARSGADHPIQPLLPWPLFQPAGHLSVSVAPSAALFLHTAAVSPPLLKGGRAMPPAKARKGASRRDTILQEFESVRKTLPRPAKDAASRSPASQVNPAAVGVAQKPATASCSGGVGQPPAGGPPSIVQRLAAAYSLETAGLREDDVGAKQQALAQLACHPALLAHRGQPPRVSHAAVASLRPIQPSELTPGEWQAGQRGSKNKRLACWPSAGAGSE